MQVFGNVATAWERKVSKATAKGYWQGRLAESQKGLDSSPTFYTVRLMVDKDPGLKLGDFVRVTGKLKCDFYIGRDGKPTGSLLVIAFEACKIAKNTVDPQPQTACTEKAKELVTNVVSAPNQEKMRPADLFEGILEAAIDPDPMQTTSSWAEW